ncbi:MAG: glycosyltransferase family 4 protein [Flavobacteriales bacterium]|nr:glycosyltransferase family 4 protein [Flavobacteriales bacterium]
MRRALVAVTNDLATDNRVDRTCRVLQDLGYEVLLVGRKLPESPPVERPYATRRMRLLFRRGPLFYTEYSARLFLVLLCSPVQLIVANDLDTLLPCQLVARLRRRRLVYDSHEFFTEVPELQGRFARRVWLAIERWIFPRLKHVVTVNNSIAAAYRERYGVEVQVVRNIPVPRELGPRPSRRELGLPEDRFILVLQGSGLNVQRGAEEAVQAMRELPDCLLLLIGGGDAWPVLEQLVQQLDLGDRVRMLERMPYARMMDHTRNADLGLSLDKDTNLNYRFSLPNKLFDYFHAGIPVLCTDLPEVAGLVRAHGAGEVLPAPTPQAIVHAVQHLRSDSAHYARLREGAIFAARSLDGGREREKLKAILHALG